MHHQKSILSDHTRLYSSNISGNGFDLSLTYTISESVSMPVIAYGGFGRIEDIREIIQYGLADAVSIVSVLHYNCPQVF